MGWIVLIILIGASAAALWLMRVRGGLLTAALAALMLGASGYALQGRPTLTGSPAQGSEARDALPLTSARHAFFGDFSAAETWLRMSEALARTGNTEDAVNILQNAVRRYPGDPQLWVGLGNALVDHGHGLSPASEMAFTRAAELSPGYPGPRFFYGVALVRSGNPEAALAIWRDILATAPPDVSWRPLVESGVAALSSGGAPPAR